MATVIPGKAAFIHVPKNCGMAIRSVLVADGGIHYGLHTTASDMRRGLPEWSELFSFAFVRNPWSRTVSFYEMFNVGQSFQTFLDDPQSIWRTQQSYYTDDVSFIGRYENLMVDWCLVANRLKLPTVLPKVNVGRPHTDYREYYNSETWDMVHKIHARDIERFGYQ